MSDIRLRYERINAVKVIVENPKGKILLIQEPETNEWMPGRWGLPGGRPYEKESLRDALDRKMKEEVGFLVKPKGIFKIEELLIEGRTVLMFIVVANAPLSVKPKPGVVYKWADKTDIEKMSISDFTEYYNQSLLSNYFENKDRIVPFDLIETRNYYIFSGTSEYMKWWETRKK